MVVIEPIRNQYLTALKERQHIIDKLNEIIRGLNALDFDDLTTIHTELVSIREALTTQNQTIIEINDNIEQIESELTSFDNRLIGLNADITDTEAHLTEFENDTIANLQAKVNKNGDTMTGNLGIPTTATGVRNNLAVNGERLQNDLDSYSQMVRLTGNQTAKGLKSGNFSVKEFPLGIPTPDNNGKYRLLYKIKGLTETNIGIRLSIQDVSNTSNIYFAIMQVIVSESFNGVQGVKLESKTANYTDINTGIYFGYKKGEIDIWYKATQYRPKSVVIERITSYGNILQPDIDIYGEIYTDDYTTYDNYLITGDVQ